MKRTSFKTRTLAIILSAIIAAAGTGIGVYALNDANIPSEQTASVNTADKSQKKSSPSSKDETVYVLSSADGTVNKIIVSDWLKNPSGKDSIKDCSDLTDIMNVKGDEAFTEGADNSLVWDAKGGDIYYTGTSDKELPVTMSVKYYLNGSEISPSELAGKSGRVRIRFDYRNTLYKTVTIDGREEKINVPFAVLTGAMLDNSIFTNVEVTNGKLINDGDKTVVVGITLPGVQEALDIDREKLEIPDYFEITADSENFEFNETVTVITNEPFNKISVDAEGESFTDLDDAMKKLTDATDSLAEGSDKLYEGLNTLLDKSSELIGGIDKLVEGAEALKNGTSDLADGSSELAKGASQLNNGSKQLAEGSNQVSGGANDLSSGLDELSQNSAALSNGGKQVFDSLLSAASSQLKAAGLDVPNLTVDNYNKVLREALSALSEENVREQAEKTAHEKVTEAVNAKEQQIRAGVIEAVKSQVEPKVAAAVRENVKSQVLASQGMTAEQYESAIKSGAISESQQAAIEAAVEAQMNTEKVKSVIEANVQQQLQSPELQALINDNVEEQKKLLISQNLQSAEVREQINAAVGAAKSGRDSITALIAQLDSYNEFYTGLTKYTSGVNQAAMGAEKLKDGAEALSKGADDLNSGAARLEIGTQALKKGAESLDSGAGQLLDGLQTLKDSAPALIDGIRQLRDGSKELSEGMKQYKEEGIQKLIDAVDGDLTGLINRINALSEASESYTDFSGSDEETEGSVKFIYRTDNIKNQSTK